MWRGGCEPELSNKNKRPLLSNSFLNALLLWFLLKCWRHIHGNDFLKAGIRKIKPF
jgi:hypothetical protein